MSFSDERDYEEEAANRRLMEEETDTFDDVPTGGADYIGDAVEYDDDLADHDFDCDCIFCIPGF